MVLEMKLDDNGAEQTNLLKQRIARFKEMMDKKEGKEKANNLLWLYRQYFVPGDDWKKISSDYISKRDDFENYEMPEEEFTAHQSFTNQKYAHLFPVPITDLLQVCNENYESYHIRTIRGQEHFIIECNMFFKTISPSLRTLQALCIPLIDSLMIIKANKQLKSLCR